MNIFVATLKSTATNPAMPSIRREAAISQLKDLATSENDPRSSDASLALAELEPTSTDNKQPEPTSKSEGLSESADDEIAAKLSEPKRNIFEESSGASPSEPLSPEADLYFGAFINLKIPDAEEEPGILAKLKTLHKESRHSIVREKAFRGICILATHGRNSRANKPAEAYIRNFSINQQVAESGGIEKLTDAVLLLHLRDIPDPTSRTDDPLVLEGARRVQIYSASLLRRVLSPDYLTINVDPGKARHGADMENADELVLLFGCPVKTQQAATA